MTDRSRDATSVQSFPFRRYVRVPKSLNLKEEEYVTGRQAVVEKCLKDNGIKYRQEHVPVIAVLGSGGGERAMVGLLGVLAQMGEDKLLDSITYLCGVSGCTWCMASLYEDPKWSVNVAADKDQILERLSNGKFSILDMLDWLSEAVEDENYSLTDFWAATVVYYIIKEIDRHHLSEQEARDSTNPYPIYTAIDKGLKQDNQTAPCWFEITPHEAGYSLLGAYVDTSHFGSQFEAGKLKKAIKEEDMLYLQGRTRKVDLILFFDFSRDDPFLTVKKAADYCKEAGIPFPSVVIEPGEEKNPKDFYVFKMKKAPIVIHIPLFNTVNCGGWVIYRPSNPKKIEEWRKRYKLFRIHTARKMIEDLLLVSSRNVKNKKEKILNEIKAACAR
ncbi:LOW QUALITY PROTEIN: cytosolic phospholipase A2 gamma-like [Scleropages formosus]|uniref:LOW QUALITY PROTEIN: cytosolic phospholipase A2 gamma-like n=1 Tax=Scleropages formosus TaxID=113540 RepID=UPI0010FAA374|nr:LOW QUALITY PROTEIN: cytosolic phospholipase A2 gamma-like [Scleropages formosus]